MAIPTGKFLYTLIGIMIVMFSFLIVGIMLGILLQGEAADTAVFIGLGGFILSGFVLLIVKSVGDDIVKEKSK